MPQIFQTGLLPYDTLLVIDYRIIIHDESVKNVNENLTFFLTEKNLPLRLSVKIRNNRINDNKPVNRHRTYRTFS